MRKRTINIDKLDFIQLYKLNQKELKRLKLNRVDKAPISDDRKRKLRRKIHSFDIVSLDRLLINLQNNNNNE